MANSQRKENGFKSPQRYKTIIRKCKKGGEYLQSTRQDYSIKSDIKAGLIDCVNGTCRDFTSHEISRFAKLQFFRYGKDDRLAIERSGHY